YGRAMKRACRARDQVEPIHPDATVASAQPRTPEATFDIEINGKPASVLWQFGKTPPDELSTIAVFDSHCARAYLTAEQEIAYLPYGLDVVENLANKVLPEMSRRLEAEIAGIDVDPAPFASLIGSTRVGQLVANLSERTQPADVERLGNLSEAEEQQLSELARALSEADPIAKANDLILSARRLKGLSGRVDNATVVVSDDHISKLKTVACETLEAVQAEELAAEEFRSGDNLLPGTGGPVWKILFEAARRFSIESAYPGHEFPNVEAGAICPLCQQPLDEGAQRLSRFEQHVQADTARIAAEKRRALAAVLATFAGTSVSLNIDAALTEELELLDKQLALKVVEFGTALVNRHGAIVKAAEDHKWDSIQHLPACPRTALRELAARQLKSARTFKRASDQTHRMQLTGQRDELQARKNLAPHLQALLALIERMATLKKLEKCRSDLKTKKISDKSKELANSAVTTSLKSALDAEFKALGIGHIGTKLNGRNDKGKMKYRLVLDLPTAHQLHEILSEGEQRAIAIGSFLAELMLANHSGGIVFDDPVSSLDHWRRQHVAKRLVAEASKRQVIVMTHDTAFLGQLLHEIEQAGIAHTMQWLEWDKNCPGFVRDGAPYEHQSYKQRLDALGKAHRRLRDIPWPAYPNAAHSALMRTEYDHFRSTIERVIQDVVFNGVIGRYRDWIRVDSLEAVVGFSSAEHNEIARLHKRSCDVITGHDPASAKNVPVPTADELEQDIAALQAVIDAIQIRRQSSKANGAAPPIQPLPDTHIKPRQKGASAS
ncbi:MAG: AAA family ATPase, partial [Planctomycetes bacterium]|nr:AAA family ATPase [Planctomycetota bacterium]